MSIQAETAIPAWTLGDRLRKARESAGIKQEEIAQRLAKSRAAIAGWEGDKHRPDQLAIRAWAHETNVPIWWIVGANDPNDGSTLGVRASRWIDDNLADLWNRDTVLDQVPLRLVAA